MVGSADLSVFVPMESPSELGAVLSEGGALP